MGNQSLERKFLHDVSTSVGTALFLVEGFLESMKSRDPENPDFEQMKGVMGALIQVKRLIEARRAEVIHEQNQPTD